MKTNLLGRKIYLILSVICIFAAILRFYSINSVPVSLYWDEAASAYNSYSILQTGKDEYGTPFPVLFRSFNDYKPPGNIYLTTIPIAIFGLNEFSARFTSAFFGTLSVPLLFFLLRELFFYAKPNIRFKKNSIAINKDLIALLSAAMLVISPWHIQFSRTGFEANIALFFLLLGVYLFLIGLRKSIYFYFLGMVIFAWNFYVYRSILVLEPLLLIGLFIIFYKQLFEYIRLRNISLGVVFFIIVLLPFFPTIISKDGMVREQQVSVFTNSQQQIYSIISERAKNNNIVGKALFNEKSAYAEVIAENYISHFSPNFLFFSGDPNGRHGPHGMGLLYLWEAPFFIIGILATIFLSRKVKTIIFGWILIAPIPAALSVPTPHALRSLNGLPILLFFTAFGVYIIFQLLKNKKRQIILGFALSVVILAFFMRYLYLYYDVTAKITSADWGDGYKELTQYVFAHQQNYQKVVISGHYWQPYIYFLFYKQYPPALYQKYGSKKGFDKYIFGGTSWDKAEYSQELGGVNLQQFAHEKHILVALSPQEWSKQINKPRKLTEIYDHDNNLVFIVGDYQ